MKCLETSPSKSPLRKKREVALRPTAVQAVVAHAAPPSVSDALRSAGQPLDSNTRALIEPRFGHDFGQVRVHTDAEAAESAHRIDALAYTVGSDLAFAEGQYQPNNEKGLRLLAHELAHVVQQPSVPRVASENALKLGAVNDQAEREANAVADSIVSRNAKPLSFKFTSQATPVPTLRRKPDETTVVVTSGASTTAKKLPQGKGGSGAVVYTYSAHGQKIPPDKDIKKPGLPFDIDLPILVYPPIVLNPPKVDLFVFFHGMRADYGEGKPQGSEPIALWSHLKEAGAATDRIAIAPQAPATSRLWTETKTDPTTKAKKEETIWQSTTAQWGEALTNIGFDGLVKIVLDGLTRDLGLTNPLVPGRIHVAGHSAGGLGIQAATNRVTGAKTLGDMVQDVTLQDAGYSFAHWNILMDWFLEGTPGKTIRVLMSEQEGPPSGSGGTRSVLSNWFNVKKINDVIATKKKSDELEAESVGVPAAKDQKPRSGGFVLESQIVVKNKKTSDIQGTMVAFFAPGGGHYETVTSSQAAAAAAGPKTTTDFLGEAKTGRYRVINGAIVVYEDKDLKKSITKRSGRKDVEVTLPRDTIVEVTALQFGTPPKETTARYIAKVKSSDGVEGWTPLASLSSL